MRRNWTRRKFLESSLKSSLAMSGAMAAFASAEPIAAREAGKAGPSTAFPPRTRTLLRAAMDEIIPAGDGMPAASEVGGVEYLSRLARQSPNIRRSLEKSLAALDGVSKKEFHRSFLSLSRPDRARALGLLEQQSPPDSFNTLRDFVYEAYYAQPQVWKLIGYEFHPTDQAGPRMKPFDESVLAQVKKMPKLYREVS